jgi:parvulin-like peptidyl-prolyl isomerase
MGWISQGATFPQLEEVLFEMSPGDISDRLETPLSLHILKVLDVRPPGVTPFQELKPDIVVFLSDYKIDLAFQQRMEELVNQAQIKFMDPELESAYEEYIKAAEVEENPLPDSRD